MADIKKTPVATQEPGSSGRPPRVIPETEYVVGQPPQPPIRVSTSPQGYGRPARFTGKLPSGREVLVFLNGQWVNVDEAERILGGPVPSGTPMVEKIQPGTEEARRLEAESLRPEEGYTKPATKPQPVTRLAQEIKPTKTRATTEDKPEQEYFQKDQDRIAEFKKIMAELPPGPKKEVAQDFGNKAVEQAQKNVEEKDGPVPIENLPIIKKMVAEFKDFYYQGYAATVAKAKERAGEQAWNAEYGQKQAIQYGMSSLTDLHRGLDLASWNFFFKLLGPLGSILEKYHKQKIGWDMSYYGRAWWSPYRIDYLIKTLPEEKAFDLAYEAFRNTIYYVNKIAGSPIFSKTARYDRFGRKVGKDFIVFTPLLKLQNGVNIVGALADDISQRNTYAISLAFQKYQEDKKKFPKNSPEFKKAKDDWIKFKNDNGDKIRNKLARFLGLRSVAKNIRRTERDPLSFLAILIGEWLFNITVGNLFRATLGAVAERLAASKFGVAMQEFFSGKYMTAGKMLGGGLVEAGRAVFSVNTFGGGLIGYQVGGVPGAILGSGGGWFWQTVRNFGLDAARMEWTQRYLDFLKDEKYFGGKFTTRGFVLGPKLALQPTWARFFDFKWNIAGRTISPFRWMFTPGPISRFANWLNTGTLQTGAFKIPIGQLIKPIPSVFINGTLIRFYVSPFLTELGTQLGWDPAVINFLNSGVFQYGVPALWEYRPLFGRLWNNVFQRFFFADQGFSMMPREGLYRISFTGGGPGVGFVYDRLGNIKYVAYEEGGSYRLVKPTGFYKNILEVRSGIWQGYQNTVAQPLSRIIQTFLQEHQTINSILNKAGNYFGNLQKVGLTNLAGFFIGFEIVSLATGGNLIAAFMGGAAGYVSANFVLNTIGTLLGKFGINFVPLFNAGFWTGALFQGIMGLAGYTLTLPFGLPSFLFPIITGFSFAFAPSVLAWVGSWALWGGAASLVGSFITGLGASLAAGTLALMPLIVVGSIATVAALAVFSIIIIGSAFWIPIQENLAGLTAVSPCFDISSPSFVGKNDNKPIFTNGEEKKVCWTTTNKQDFYQDAIVKTKIFDPPNSFKILSYDVTVSRPGQQPVVWNNSLGLPASFTSPDGLSLKVDVTHGTIGTGDEVQDAISGLSFSLWPPVDKQQLISNNLGRARQIYDQINSSQKPITFAELFAQEEVGAFANQITNGSLLPSESLLTKEINYLNSLINTSDPGQLKPLEDRMLNELKNTNVASFIKFNPHLVSTSLVLSENLKNIVHGCLIWQNQAALVLPPSPAPAPPFSSCSDLLSQINQYDGAGPGSPNSPYNQMAQFISGAKSLSPKDRLDLRKQLQAQQKQANDIIKNLRGEYDFYKNIADIKINPNLPPAQKEKTINDLLTGVVTTYLNQLGASNLRYLPQNTTITVCLNVRYDGANNTVATIMEKDSAQLPLLGQIGVPSCQAQLITPINASGPGNLQWPTDKRELVGGYNGHKGRDLKGTPGKPVTFASSGTIIKEGYEPNGFGYYRIVAGDDGFYYIYAHLGQSGFGPNSAFSGKRVGEKIQAGESLGYFGSSGNVTGPHLHFGVSTSPELSSFYNNSNTTLDPCLFFAGGCP